MSILKNYILNEFTPSLAGQIGLGGGAGALIGGLGGHLYGKYKFRNIDNESEKQNKIDTYRDRGMIGGAIAGGIGAAAGTKLFNYLKDKKTFAMTPAEVRRHKNALGDVKAAASSKRYAKEMRAKRKAESMQKLKELKDKAEDKIKKYLEKHKKKAPAVTPETTPTPPPAVPVNAAVSNTVSKVTEKPKQGKRLPLIMLL